VTFHVSSHFLVVSAVSASVPTAHFLQHLNKSAAVTLLMMCYLIVDADIDYS